MNEIEEPLHTAEAEAQRMKSTSSWRVTGPFRSLNRPLRLLTAGSKAAIQLPSRIRSQRRLRREAALIAASGLFDHEKYLIRNPDVARAGIDPIIHYLRYGAMERRNPSNKFDTDWYLRQNQDVLETMINPLVHFIQYGKAEGRHPLQRRTLDLTESRSKADCWAKEASHWRAVLDAYGERPLTKARVGLSWVDQQLEAVSSSKMAVLPAIKSRTFQFRLYRLISLLRERLHGKGQYHRSLERWQGVVGRAKLHISIARRLADVEAYKASIDDYNADRPLFLAANLGTPRIAVYTAISGGYDSVKLPEILDSRLDYVLFTDTPSPQSRIFRVEPMTYHSNDLVRNARFVKTHPHMLLNGYDIAIWLDGNIMILGEFYKLVEEFLASGKLVAAVPHPFRKTAVDELAACVKLGKDDDAAMHDQVFHYLCGGAGCTDLIESNLMMFDLRNERVRLFLNRWWSEIDRFSKRDQLSFSYALDLAGINWHSLIQRPHCVRDHPAFAIVEHNGTDQGGILMDALKMPIVDPYSGQPFSNVRGQRISAQKHRTIDVVVCVHNALGEVRKCLASLCKVRNSERQRLIIVDDGSEENTARFLSEFAASAPWTELHRNEKALCYTKAANQALAASTGELVILLNSDTIVADGWAEKLADAVFSTAGAGIVGPVSNAASHQSIPNHLSSREQTAVNELPPGVNVDDMNTHCEQWTVANVLPRVPLIHGFCFGITRQVIDKIGYFDEQDFPEGFGEENDYCFRAVDAGFSLVIAAHTYVFHAKSKSYGNRRTALVDAGMVALQQRYGLARIRRAVSCMEENVLLVGMRDKARALYCREGGAQSGSDLPGGRSVK